MEYTHYAAIDIGSNAVRLLVKRLDDEKTGHFSKDVLLRVPLRLGQEVFTSGGVSPKKKKKLVELMKAYAIVMNLYDVEKPNFRVCATASMREAKNSAEVVEAVRREVGLDIEVISGEEEASIVCNLRSPDDKRRLVYVDVGGGSTEVSLMNGSQKCGRRSFPVGTVKLINGVAPEDWKTMLSEGVKKMACENPSSEDGTNMFSGAVIVGAGGNINKLFTIAQDRDAAERSMSVSSLRKLHGEMASMNLKRRMAAFKLKPDRADVIVPAAEIFITIAESLGIEEIEIPTDSLADGIIADLWYKSKKQKKQ